MTCHQEIDQMSCHHRNKMTEVEHDCMGGGELKLFRHFWAKFLHVWFSTLCKEGVGIETAVDWTDWPKGCDFCAILKPTPSGQIVFKRLVLGAESLNPTEVGSLPVGVSPSWLEPFLWLFCLRKMVAFSSLFSWFLEQTFSDPRGGGHCQWLLIQLLTDFLHLPCFSQLILALFKFSSIKLASSGQRRNLN